MILIGKQNLLEDITLVQMRCAWLAGMDPKKTQRYRRNRYYKSAMHAAVDCPDLAMLRCESSRTASDRAEANGCLLPGTKQVRCSLPWHMPQENNSGCVARNKNVCRLACRDHLVHAVILQKRRTSSLKEHCPWSV